MQGLTSLHIPTVCHDGGPSPGFFKGFNCISRNELSNLPIIAIKDNWLSKLEGILDAMCPIFLFYTWGNWGQLEVTDSSMYGKFTVRLRLFPELLKQKYLSLKTLWGGEDGIKSPPRWPLMTLGTYHLLYGLIATVCEVLSQSGTFGGNLQLFTLFITLPFCRKRTSVGQEFLTS